MLFSMNSIVSLIMPLVGIIIVMCFFKKVAKNCGKKETHKSQQKRGVFVKTIASAYKPIIMLLSFLYIKYVFLILKIAIHDNVFLKFLFEDAFYIFNLMLITWIISVIINEFKVRIEKKFTFEEKTTTNLNNNSRRTKVDALVKVIYGVWLTFALILALGNLGVPLGSIVALGGMSSIVIGFATKDLLGDYVSGFLIYLDGQFDIGEWIKLKDLDIEGTVEYIGWRVSRIRTFDDKPLYVPNNMLSKNIVQNVSRRVSMRIKEYITVSIESANSMSVICKEIRNDVLLNHDGIDQTRKIVVNLTSLQAGVCWIYVSAFTKSADMQGFYGIKQDILLKINAILQAHSVNIESPKVSTHQLQSTS